MPHKPKIVASIEARMTSSRLPGKTLMNAIDNISMLEFMINRVRQSFLLDDVIVATTTNETDNPIIELCERIGVNYFRGSEPDVLKRVVDTHKHFNTDIIVELTGDCPLLDPALIDKVIQLYLDNNVDYVSNAHVRSYPDGMDVQVFSSKVLEEVERKTTSLFDRENVSTYIYGSGEYSLKADIAEKEIFWPDLRITLDDVGDLKLIQAIIRGLYPLKGYNFTLYDIVDFLHGNINLLKLNANARVSDISYQTIAIKGD